MRPQSNSLREKKKSNMLQYTVVKFCLSVCVSGCWIYLNDKNNSNTATTVLRLFIQCLHAITYNIPCIFPFFKWFLIILHRFLCFFTWFFYTLSLSFYMILGHFSLWLIHIVSLPCARHCVGSDIQIWRETLRASPGWVGGLGTCTLQFVVFSKTDKRISNTVCNLHN